jgi:hypothetical protein
LLGAIAEHLSEHVLGKLTGHDAFNLRVAINAVRIMQREAALSPALDAAETQRLAALLDRSGALPALNAELCRRIRSGEIQQSDPALRAHLLVTALGKLSIDNPKYATYLHAKGGARSLP